MGLKTSDVHDPYALDCEDAKPLPIGSSAKRPQATSFMLLRTALRTTRSPYAWQMPEPYVRQESHDRPDVAICPAVVCWIVGNPFVPDREGSDRAYPDSADNHDGPTLR